MSALFNAVIRGSIRHRQLVLAGAVVLVLFGIWSARSVRLDALPGFSPPMVSVQAEAPGLGSSDVERLLTTPLEQGLLGIPDVANIRSVSSAGLALIRVTFEDQVDIFRARQLVSERLALTQERLPVGLPVPRLSPISAPVGALMKFTYTVEAGGAQTLAALWRFAHWKLLPRLSAIEGVSNVTVHGGAAPRVEVRPHPVAMLARGVSLGDLRQALSSAQGMTPLGRLRVGAQWQALRANGLWPLDALDPIANTVLRLQQGLPLRVADVADVGWGRTPAVGSALQDGKQAIYLQVDKLPWADTLGITAQVDRVLAALDRELPAGARRQPAVFRQADFIHTSLVAVGRAMGIGALFVMAVLMAFLRSPRLAVISLTALPLSIVAAASVLWLRGVTFNGMILGGLAIAVGEVVDDAIVDAENIWRRLRENAHRAAPRAPLQVIHDASCEIRGSVVYASLIVVVVLAPLMLLGGLSGRIFSPLAESYALAVAASLLVALTVTPALSAVLLPRLADRAAGETRLTRLLRGAYERGLARLHHAPGRIVLISAMLGLAALAALPLLGGGFLPEFREGVLIAEVSAWPGTSLEETTRLARLLDARLRGPGGLPHVATRVGRASLDEDAAPVYRMELDLVLPDAGGEPEQVAADIMAQMAKLPGVRFHVDGFLGERINELLSGERAPVAVKLYADDLDALRARASELMAQVARVPGVRAVTARSLVDQPTTDLRFSESGLARAGVRRGEVLDAVAVWQQGLEVSRINAGNGFSVPVALASGASLAGDAPSAGLPASAASSAVALADLPVFAASSAALPLSMLVDVQAGAEPPTIEHEDGQRVVSLSANVAPARISPVADRIDQLVAAMDWPAGTHAIVSGQAAERRAASGRLALITALVLGAVFAFLWMAFDSLVDACVVIAGLPLGMVGGVLTALLFPDGVSMAGLVGFIALAGIISRNGIMLVAHKNQLLAGAPDGDRQELILQAARERLLPILMTAATAFFGMLPLALSIDSAGSELESPMALIVASGLVSSTVLNLVAVPAFYLWRERRRALREAAA